MATGEQLAYHVNTFGHLVGELVRRIGGAGPGEALAARRPAGGRRALPGAVRSAAPLRRHGLGTRRSGSRRSTWTARGLNLLHALAHFNPPGYSRRWVMNTPRWRSLPLGSTSGHGNGGRVACIYSALLDDDRLLSPALLRAATTVQAVGHRPILDDELSYGLGFATTTDRRRLGPNPGAFGHYGTGGSLGFADPCRRDRLRLRDEPRHPRWQSTRNRALIDAVYRSLHR